MNNQCLTPRQAVELMELPERPLLVRQLAYLGLVVASQACPAPGHGPARVELLEVVFLIPTYRLVIVESLKGNDELTNKVRQYLGRDGLFDRDLIEGARHTLVTAIFAGLRNLTDEQRQMPLAKTQRAVARPT